MPSKTLHPFRRDEQATQETCSAHAHCQVRNCPRNATLQQRRRLRRCKPRITHSLRMSTCICEARSSSCRRDSCTRRMSSTANPHGNKGGNSWHQYSTPQTLVGTWVCQRTRRQVSQVAAWYIYPFFAQVANSNHTALSTMAILKQAFRCTPCTV